MQVKVTRNVVIAGGAGAVAEAGSVVEVTDAQARELMAMGRAVLPDGSRAASRRGPLTRSEAPALVEGARGGDEE